MTTSARITLLAVGALAVALAGAAALPVTRAGAPAPPLRTHQVASRSSDGAQQPAGDRTQDGLQPAAVSTPRPPEAADQDLDDQDLDDQDLDDLDEAAQGPDEPEPDNDLDRHRGRDGGSSAAAGRSDGGRDGGHDGAAR